jgi:hypothetical protein
MLGDPATGRELPDQRAIQLAPAVRRPRAHSGSL